MAYTRCGCVISAHLDVQFDGSFASKQYFELVNEDRIAQDAYELLNARVAWHSADDKWQLGV
ncbi:MAG TPA: hypothetical protein VK437_05785 [Steroidobacteraceae bacterium]|nr:hypothetical protein [Steroidobacteraceae bacterium]